VFIDGVNLNIELVRNGLARVVLYEKRAKIKYQDELLSAEKEAREKSWGFGKNKNLFLILTDFFSQSKE